jgi:hypothetical protein
MNLNVRSSQRLIVDVLLVVQGRPTQVANDLPDEIPGPCAPNQANPAVPRAACHSPGDFPSPTFRRWRGSFGLHAPNLAFSFRILRSPLPICWMSIFVSILSCAFEIRTAPSPNRYIPVEPSHLRSLDRLHK